MNHDQEQEKRLKPENFEPLDREDLNAAIDHVVAVHAFLIGQLEKYAGLGVAGEVAGFKRHELPDERPADGTLTPEEMQAQDEEDERSGRQEAQ